ncbi:glutathione S-transferase family protein [Mesorhizobium sp. KR9-304]|uniref:glutathione S-transferase family protein n=1 Tax=Mesorhizobium sp. KR9-304 TaxID=3156614 RepID=UPI0032B49E8F
MTILLYDLVGEDASRPFSPHCWKTTMCLAHKGLDYRRVPTPFTSVPAVEGGVSKTVPVIRDGDTVVADSFTIALYLDEAYPDRPTLFGGKGGEAMARFIERWSQLTIHPYLGAAALTDIHARLAPPDQAYFRDSREKRYGKSIEDVSAEREAGLAAFRASLEPLRSMLTYQPFIGGATPLYPDYIVFGAFQWVRVMSPFPALAEGDPVAAWFEQLLDLHDGLGRSVAAA